MDLQQALAGVRVLVVDDDDDARELLKTGLAQAGAVLSVATSMREALERLDASQFDVLLSDIAMPGGTGYDLVHAVRANPRTAALPAIALTAYSRNEDRSRALSAGFDFHLGKPFELAILIRTLALAAAKKPGEERGSAG